MAAGVGKRMKSALPKVLHELAGRPLCWYPFRAAKEAGAREVVLVLSPDARAAVEPQLTTLFSGTPFRVAIQSEPRGTGDAVKAGLGEVKSDRVLILSGDTPLLRADDVKRLVEAFTPDTGVSLALLSSKPSDPDGYGRVLRDAEGNVLEVREQRDLRSDVERAVPEVNAGAYVLSTRALADALGQLRADNAQAEYYLTDIVAILAKQGRVVGVEGHAESLAGVNDRNQLHEAEEALYQRIARHHRQNGVTVQDGARIDDSVEIESDARIGPGVILRGKTRVQSGAIIDVGCVITDSVIGPKALLKPYSVVSESRVDAGAQIGPFAHLRPGSEIEADAHIGNFVETKKTRVRRGAKANHLAYLGDGDIGEGANVGAGTIFCNYDGFKKHKTTIEKGAFIGSDSQIVAPVTIGENAYVATGTTVTRDVPADALAISRVKQENKEGYGPRLRARLSKK
jgi:bifunctional UDP-N-acetylglucosamine pyrophosphorylase/glucosamine-1-phosphate N-acetyltransferase